MSFYKSFNSAQTSLQHTTNTTPSTNTETQNPIDSTEQEIDLDTLSNKIYALLRQELRLERERLGYYRP